MSTLHSYAGRAKIKAVESAITIFWTAWNRFYLSGFVTIGKSVKFRGRVIIESCGGKVIIGSRCKIGSNVQLSAATGSQLVIGDDVTINTGSQLVARKAICIGALSMIGEYCSIRDNDHEWRGSAPIRDQGYSVSSVEIGRDVWLGRGVTVGKGVKIGDGSVVGASSVVSRSIGSFEVVVGVPAHVINHRGPPG